MAIAGNNIVAWLGWAGFAEVASASCDYPAVTDVRNGVSFGSGTYTGTLGVGLGVSGDSYLTDWVNNWKSIVSESATFQAWTGAADETEALDWIYEWAIDYDALDTDTDWPFCLVMNGSNQNVSTIAASGPNITTREQGDLRLVFEGIVPDGYTHKQACDWMSEKCFAIVSELRSIAVSDAFLQILRGIKLEWGPARADEEEKNAVADIMQMSFIVQLGLGG